jgi:hypothetical protein
MKKFVLLNLLLLTAVDSFGQPGGYTIPRTPDPLDDYVLGIEEYINERSAIEMEVFAIQDSGIEQLSYDLRGGLPFIPDSEPEKKQDEVLFVYLLEDEIHKIVLGDHTFHFKEGYLLRSWQFCSQVTAMGQCGGFVTSAHTFWYWSGDQVHRSIGWQSHRHPCQCFERVMYDYRSVMSLYKKAESSLMASELKKK